MFIGPVLNSGPLRSTSSAAVDADGGGDVQRVEVQHPVRQHGALRRPRRARRVDDQPAARDSGRSGSQRTVGRRREQPRQVRRTPMTPQDPRVEARAPRAPSRRTRPAASSSTRLGVARARPRARARHARAQRDEDRAEARAGEQQVEQLGRVVAEVRDPVARGDRAPRRRSAPASRATRRSSASVGELAGLSKRIASRSGVRRAHSAIQLEISASAGGTRPA